MKREVVHGIPFSYSEDPPAFRPCFMVCFEDKDAIVYKEYMLPRAFSEEMRQGISHSAISTVSTVCYEKDGIKKGAKEYCQRHSMDLIEISFPSLEAENSAVKNHMKNLYRTEIDFEPLTDFRLLKLKLRPSP